MALSKEQFAEILKLYYKHYSPQTVIRMMRKSYQEILFKLNKMHINYLHLHLAKSVPHHRTKNVR